MRERGRGRDVDVGERGGRSRECVAGITQDPDSYAIEDSARVQVVHGLDEVPARMVVEELSLALVSAAIGRTSVVEDPAGSARGSRVGALEDLVPGFLGVRGKEHLVRLAAGEPWPIALMALRGAGRPGLTAVLRGEQRVVGQVDARVVDVARPRPGSGRGR